MTQEYFEYSSEVAYALANNLPILALESTLITHGLDYPHNVQIAEEVEAITRHYGVTPATIAVLKGKIKIGLSKEELQQLVDEKNIYKASTRDLPYLISHGLSAGTTVAATMYCAHQANIKVFATGGIGGVHRGDDLDISADLLELSRTPVAVVCAGAKAILDIGRTLEYLETHGVPVIGYQTDKLPGFYSSRSKFQLNTRVDNIEKLVQLISMHFSMKLNTGMIIANPIPITNEILDDEIEPVIQQSLAQAQKDNVRGKALTPFLLRHLAHATAGKSVQANLALIKNNVRVGAQLAAELCESISPGLRGTTFRLSGS